MNSFISSVSSFRKERLVLYLSYVNSECPMRKLLPDKRFKKAWGKDDKLHYLALFLAK